MARWLVLLALPACTIGGGDAVWTVDDDVRGVSASLGNGDLGVLSEDRDDVRIEWSGGGVGDAACPEIEIEDGVLMVDADSGLVGGGDLYITVPLGTKVEGCIDRGSLFVDLAAPSDVKACVKQGDVVVSVPPGAYDLELSALIGSIVIEEGVQDDDASPYVIDAHVSTGSLIVESRIRE